MSYRMTSKIPFDTTENEIRLTIERWGGRHLSVDTLAHNRRYDKDKNLVQGKDAPWTEQTRAVTVSFEHPSGKRLTFTENRHERPADNIRVLYLCLEDMRMNEVRGFDQVMQSAFLQLAAPASADDWWVVLGVRADADEDEVQAAYRKKARETHPDAGGDAEAFKRVNEAFSQWRNR